MNNFDIKVTYPNIELTEDMLEEFIIYMIMSIFMLIIFLNMNGNFINNYYIIFIILLLL